MIGGQMETYQITKEDAEREEAGPPGWRDQFWADVFARVGQDNE